MTYIYERRDWPRFSIHHEKLATRLARVRHEQGRLLGRMEGLGFRLRAEAALSSLTEEVLKSNEIEGETLDRDQVRSSLARRLGVDVGAPKPADRGVEGVVEMMLDATQRFAEPLTKARLRMACGAFSDGPQRDAYDRRRRLAQRCCGSDARG